MPSFPTGIIPPSQDIPLSQHKALAQIIWSKELHERVRKKLFWNQFIGKNLADEGAMETPSVGSPIVEYSEFGRQRGDQIIIPIEFPLNEDPRTSGVIGAEILTGTEEEIKYGGVKLYIEEWRRAVIVENLPLQQQKTSINLIERHLYQLEKASLGTIDNSFSHAYIWGWSPNLQRSAELTGFTLSTSVVKPYAHPNTYYYVAQPGGKPGLVKLSDFGTGTTPYPAITDSWNYYAPTLDMFDQAYALLRAMEIPPYTLSNGAEKYLVIMHDYVFSIFRTNPRIQKLWLFGMERGASNPLFNYSLGSWGQFEFFSTSRIPLYYATNVSQVTETYASRATRHPVFTETGDYIKLSVAVQTSITDTVATGGNYYEQNEDGTFTQVGALAEYYNKWIVAPIFILGANAMAVAYSTMGPKGYRSAFSVVPRETSDYGKFSAYGLSAIYGIRRIDWTDYSGALFNQSGLLIWVGIRLVGPRPKEFEPGFE